MGLSQLNQMPPTIKYLIDLLKAIEREITPPARCHHALMYTQHGSDETGWEDRLSLQINRMGVFHCWFLDPGDFDKTPDQLAAEISALMPAALDAVAATEKPDEVYEILAPGGGTMRGNRRNN